MTTKQALHASYAPRFVNFGILERGFMKKLFLMFGLMAALLIVAVAASAQKVNFAGTWGLDKTKSQGLSPRLQGADKVTWTITQDDKTISIDQKVEGGQPPANMGGGDRPMGGAGGDRPMGGAGGGAGRGPGGPQVYNLDGKEAISDVALRGSTGKLTTKATTSGGTLELMRKITFTDQEGTERVNTTNQKLSLSGDGKTLTAVVHSEGGRGPSDSTLVFSKQ
jgi:hypothetical protein